MELRMVITVQLILHLVSATIEDEWDSFKKKYSKTYESIEEELERLEVFKYRTEQISEHNAKFERGEYSFKIRINQAADLTGEESDETDSNGAENGSEEFGEEDKTAWDYIKQIFHNDFVAKTYTARTNKSIDVPDEFDWRQHGVVTEIKNQSTCGSCWSFTAIAALESHYAIATGRLFSLSEQELVDCSTDNNGCVGGRLPIAFEYLAEYGISSEADYPYKNKQGVCRSGDVEMSEVKMRGYAKLEGDEENLKQAVSRFGPIAIDINVTPSTFLFYSEGIYDDSECVGTIINHSVLVIGYGMDQRTGLDFWILKNSWSKDWGEDGYMRIARNQGGICGLDQRKYFPILDHGRDNYYSLSFDVAINIVLVILVCAVLDGIGYVVRKFTKTARGNENHLQAILIFDV